MARIKYVSEGYFIKYYRVVSKWLILMMHLYGTFSKSLPENASSTEMLQGPACLDSLRSCAFP